MKNILFSIFALCVFSVFFIGCVAIETDSKTELKNIIAQPTIDRTNSNRIIVEIQNTNAVSNSQTKKNTLEIAEETVRAFYETLKTGNRQMALKFAAPKVVRQLFKQKNRNFDWKFTGCEKPKVKEYGDVICFYDFRKGGIGLFLRKITDEQFQITSTYFYNEQ